MRLVTRPPSSVAVLCGIGFDEGDELRNGLGRHGRVDHENDRRGNRKRYRREVLDGIIWRLAEECRIGHKGADIQQDGVAVRRRLRGLSSAYVAGPAGDVLDIELLVEFSREFLSDESGTLVGRSTRDRSDDTAMRSGR